MKTYSTISLLILLGFSFTGLLAQPKAQDSDNKLVLVKVASLNTIDSNKEFQKNVQLVQQQRSLAAQVLSKIEASKNQKEKADYRLNLILCKRN
jgi:alpha/beta superfamily hydrolase